MRVLLATHNPGKIKVYTSAFKTYGIDVCSLDDLGINDDYQEIGTTFEENARAKALFYYHFAKIPTLADDGGFEIDYLKGEPGVKSRRWLGHVCTDEEIVQHLNKVIPLIPPNQRSARFVAVSCLVKSKSEIYLTRNAEEGYLTEKLRKDYPAGFPYRSHFISKLGADFNDLTLVEQENQHRLKNIQELIKYL
ncbi:MAG: non-canonical purine NTP pyrophosphatase [Candidatus Komeilibacteria bacterium]|nr:non-canonical purine NTP pyrophosphatase [Candidatus Komeilibacteria bacterium]